MALTQECPRAAVGKPVRAGADGQMAIRGGPWRRQTRARRGGWLSRSPQDRSSQANPCAQGRMVAVTCAEAIW